MKKILVSVIAILATASVASASGINLSWDDCGSNGVPSKLFDCSVNSGSSFTMYASFVPAANTNQFVGIQSLITITSSTTLPNWWQHGTGFCRGTGALKTSIDFSAASGLCSDPYAGSSSPIAGQLYTYPDPTPNASTLRIQAAVPFDEFRALDAGTQYYAYHVDINRTKSTGTGSCDGCGNAVCIQLQDVDVFQADNTDNDLTNALNGSIVVWQADTALPGCQGATPVRNSTWGQVKSLYR